MFGILQPDKEKVGQRIKMVKERLDLSFTELGNRLGLKKPTINSYVQGYALAPISVIEQLASITSKPAGWFYFGSLDTYISDYLNITGNSKLVEENPQVIQMIKEDFYKGESENPMWENEVGYPAEGFIDDCFADVKYELLKNYILQIIIDEINQSNKFEDSSIENQNDISRSILAKILDYNEVTGDIQYGEKQKVTKIAKELLQDFEEEGAVTFSDQFLVGCLINILDDDRATEKLISLLSEIYTGKDFSSFFGGQELIEIFKLMRPELIHLYTSKTNEDFIEWFDK